MNQVRSMRNEDLLAYKRLCSICYTYREDNAAPEPLPEEQLRIRRGVFDEDGHLLSAMMQIPYQVRFCGHTVKMVGIGGVVTDPTARARGAIRAIFETDLPTLYREGAVLSALYPFSYRFYGKFGYVWAKFGRNMEIPREALRGDLRRADEIIRVLPEEDDRGMAEIYAQYAADKDFAVLRDAQMWKELRSGTPWENLKYAYVLRVEGKPVAYWIGQMEKKPGGAVLHMKDFAWTCQAGLEAIFAMLRGMNEVGSICVQARSGFEPALLCNEAWDVAAREECQGMVRVVNAERALALLPAPILPGMLTVEVTDAQIAENCGRFTVSSDGYRLTVTRDEHVPVDLRCDIRGLSILMVGRHRFSDAVKMGLVELLSAEKERYAEMLFAKRELHLNWSF
ncbi:MAG: enhanced intracellular survival protein Eis [Aristaeellaceae bacterium]